MGEEGILGGLRGRIFLDWRQVGEGDLGTDFFGGVVAGLGGIWEQIFGGSGGRFFRGEADLRVGWRQFLRNYDVFRKAN